MPQRDRSGVQGGRGVPGRVKGLGGGRVAPSVGGWCHLVATARAGRLSRVVATGNVWLGTLRGRLGGRGGAGSNLPSLSLEFISHAGCHK